MQDTVRFDDPKRLAQASHRHGASTFCRCAASSIEMVPSHAVDTGEGLIELIAAIVLHTPDL
jgi:hypothetical protein